MPFHLWPAVASTTRRDFLAGLAAGGAALTFGCQARGKGDDGGWFALVSDPHIDADPKAAREDQVMADNLGAVVADILAEGRKPAGVLFDGDLARRDGQPGDYATLLATVEPLRKAGIPLHFVLGNHDDRRHFRGAFRGATLAATLVEERQVGAFESLGHRFILLDSLDEVGATPGRLGEPQLHWLGDELDGHRGKPTLIFVHHNLRDNGVAGLVDFAALLDLIGPRRWVKAVVHGHTHRWGHRDEAGLPMVNLPAVGYPFQSGQPIGYCRFLADDGRGVFRLRAIGGDRSRDGETLTMKWRTS